MIKQYKDYWIGFLITALVGATVLAFKTKTSTNDFPIIIEILLGTIAAINLRLKYPTIARLKKLLS